MLRVGDNGGGKDYLATRMTQGGNLPTTITAGDKNVVKKHHLQYFNTIIE